MYFSKNTLISIVILLLGMMPISAVSAHHKHVAHKKIIKHHAKAHAAHHTKKTHSKKNRKVTQKSSDRIDLHYEGNKLIAQIDKPRVHKGKTHIVHKNTVSHIAENALTDKVQLADMSVTLANQRKRETSYIFKPIIVPAYLSKTADVTPSKKEVSDENTAPSSFTASMEKHVADFVHRTVETLRYSDYKLGGRKFDPSHGIYIVDCSSFVDHVLRRTSPRSYLSLVNATGSDTPATQHYYEFFRELSRGTDDFWDKIDEVAKLRAGDILVFRYKNSRGNETGGHVMVVMDTPIRDTNTFFVRVADSAPSRHSQDTRHQNEAGIGIGTLLLKINPTTGRPAAYAWGLGGLWNKNVNFAMARPLDIPRIDLDGTA